MVTDASRDDIVRKVDLVQALVELGVPRAGLLMVPDVRSHMELRPRFAVTHKNA